jgi:two-component system chemotaxis response regulator CheB
LASQAEKIEEMLWISLRMFEERKNLLTSMAKASGRSAARNENRRRARETQGHIDRIRGVLLEPGSDAPDDTLTHVKALMAEPRQAKSTR